MTKSMIIYVNKTTYMGVYAQYMVLKQKGYYTFVLLMSINWVI